MTELPILDPEALETLRSLSPDESNDFVKEIAGIFMDDTPQRIAELDSSLAAGDVPTFVRAAHSIKGSAANMGALRLRASAERLEKLSKDKGLADVASPLAELKALYAEAEKALRALVGA